MFELLSAAGQRLAASRFAVLPGNVDVSVSSASARRLTGEAQRIQDQKDLKPFAQAKSTN